MHNTLADSFATVLPHLSEKLVDGKTRKIIQKSTRQLPAVVRTLLECRLSARQTQVDLSQSFLIEDKETLEAFFLENTFDQTGWLNVQALIEQWSGPGSYLARLVTGVWMEFDLDPALGESMPVPGVFLTLKAKDSTRDQHKKAISALEVATGTIVGHGRGVSLVSCLASCVDKLPVCASPTYVGIMASREPTSIRAQFSGIPQHEIKKYLGSLGLNSFPQSLEVAINLAFDHFKSTVLCIDLLPDISSRIGLEIFPSKNEGNEDIVAFLDELVRRGMCSVEKREGLLSWPGRSDPGNASAAWPEHLICESLLRPTNEFSIIDRRINHFKLVCTPGQRVEAKVYLAFDHLWANFDEESVGR